MIVRTYTNMWNEEKKLYAIYDVTLPTPVSFKQIGLFVIGAVVWVPLMLLLGVPISHPIGLTAWIIPPLGIAVLGNQQVLQGKTIFQFAKSWVSFLFEPRRVLDGEAISAVNENLPKITLKKEEGKVVEEIIVHKPIELKYVTWSKKPLERI